MNLASAMILACLFMLVSSLAALAQPTPPPTTPTPTTAPAPTSSGGASSSPAAPVGNGAPPAALNSLIDPALLESLQKSIVGLVILWEEPEPTGPFAFLTGPHEPAQPPAVGFCTGWFSSETTIVTAGHCVDPAEGRRLMDRQNGIPIDPTTGEYLPPDPVRPEPARTVYAFQPRELAGAVITTPTIVRVDSFRPADEGDTAKLEIHGVPPATPLTIAPPDPHAPRLGTAVTSIGFPALNIAETDGINLNDLLDADKNPAKVLWDSRLQPVSTSGTITSQQYRNGVAVYQTNADLASGTSGGPTVNSRGQVLGINSKMTIPFIGQNFNIITDTGMLHDFLGHPQQPATPAGTPANTPAQPTNTTDALGSAVPTDWPALLAPALVGAILGAGITWLLTHTHARSRSTTTNTAHKEPSPPQNASTTNSENETPTSS